MHLDTKEEIIAKKAMLKSGNCCKYYSGGSVDQGGF
jgi:hypothetical protein